MNTLFRASYTRRGKFQELIHEQVLVVAESEYNAKQIVLDFFAPDWSWWNTHMELLIDGVSLEPGLYNPQEITEFYTDAEDYVEV